MRPIIIVRPNSKKKNYGQLDTQKLTAVEPPLWVALLAAACREAGNQVGVVDNEIENYPVEELALKLAFYRPRAVIIAVCGHNPSASTQSMQGAVELLEAMQLFGIPTVLYGLHPSALPEETLELTKANCIIVGEGFDVMASRIPLEGILRTERLADLDVLHPAWDLIPVSRYRAHNWHCFGHPEQRSPYGIVFSSFGCPYNCSFCVIHAMFNNTRAVRFRSPKLVADDIFWWVKEVGATNIRIIDENFTLFKKHVSDICSCLKARAKEEQFDLDKLNIWAYASVDTVDEAMLYNMRSVGIKWLCYGFETGNNRIAVECGKTKSHSNWRSKILNVADLTHRVGIHINANWMVGFPNDTWNTMLETLHLAQEINSAWINIYCATAYPGSALYEDAKASKIKLPKTWDGYSQYSPNFLPLPTHYLSAKEVITFRDYFFKAYFTNPMYLTKMRNLFGEDTLKSIMDMTKVDIKRNP